MPAGRRRYGPILGQILRAKGPSVPLKERAECPSDGSSYKSGYKSGGRRPMDWELARLALLASQLLDDY